MEEKKIVINLLRKIICSLACINNKTKNKETKEKANLYLNGYITIYDEYINKGNFINIELLEIIDFCNECYSDLNVFDYAEDVEYGTKELYEISKKGGK